MPFFKELRRRSRASFRTSDSSTGSSSTVPTAKSSSTLNSAQGSATPPSTFHANGSASNVVAAAKSNGDAPPPIPQRPNVTVPNSNRNSMIVRLLIRLIYVEAKSADSFTRLFHRPVQTLPCGVHFPPPVMRPKLHLYSTTQWYGLLNPQKEMWFTNTFLGLSKGLTHKWRDWRASVQVVRR